MGALGHLGLLLWKHVLRRKRQPVVLFLEVTWPLAVFLIIVLVRQGSPPKPEPECHFKPHAMPTSGTLNFLQSYLCNLQNKCHQNESESENSRFSKMLEAAGPLFDSPYETKSMLKDLPKFGAALDTMQNMLSSVGNLEDVDLKFHSFLRDPDFIHQRLSRDLNILEPPVINTLLNASVNLQKTMDILAGIDFASMACDPNLLSEHLVFEQNSDVTMVSKALCGLNKEELEQVAKLFKDQTSVSAVVRMASQLSAVTGDDRLSTALESTAEMLDVVTSMSWMDSMGGGDKQIIKGAAQWVAKASQVIRDMSEAPSGNLNVMQNILRDMQPLWKQLNMSDALLDEMNTLLNGAMHLSEILIEPTATLR